MSRPASSEMAKYASAARKYQRTSLSMTSGPGPTMLSVLAPLFMVPPWPASPSPLPLSPQGRGVKGRAIGRQKHAERLHERHGPAEHEMGQGRHPPRNQLDDPAAAEQERLQPGQDQVVVDDP